MRLRGGLWLVAFALCASAVIHGARMILVAAHEIDHFGEPPDANAAVHVFTYVADLLVDLALAVGAFACARGTRTWARRWFGLAAAAAVIPGVLELTSFAGLTFDGVEWLPLGLAVFSLFAGVAFALGGLAGGASKRLAWTVVALVVLQAAGLLVSNRAQLSATVVNEFTLLVGNIAWCFLAFEMLGAFPVLGRVPGAIVASRARTAATSVSLVFCVTGIAVLATVGWLLGELATRRVSVELNYGLACFCGGAFASWRMRRQLLLPVAFAIGFSAVMLGKFAVDLAPKLPDRLALTPQAVPGLRISLPEGKVTSPYTNREIGGVFLKAKHPEIKQMSLIWLSAETDPSTWRSEGLVGSSSKGLFGSVNVSLTHFEHDDHRWMYATWQCDADEVWYMLRTTVPERSTEVERHVHRILKTIECAPETIESAPPLRMDISLPEGYREVPAESQRQMYAREASTLEIWWLADEDFVTTLAERPEVLVAEIEPELVLGAVAWLDPLTVDGTPRAVAEIAAGDERVLVTAWYCEKLGISAMATHVGPASDPREPILAALRSARCPSAQ
jgi:hypothetical protein